MIAVTRCGSLQGSTDTKHLPFLCSHTVGLSVAMTAPGLGWRREGADETSLQVEGLVSRASPGTPWERQRSPALQISTEPWRAPVV